MNQKKKIAIGLLIGTAVMASVFAAAANITVTPETLGAGGAGVASCDSDEAVAATWTTSYSAASPTGYVVDSVKITGLHESCAGKKYKIQLTGPDGTPNAALSHTPAGATEGTVPAHVTDGSTAFNNNVLSHSFSGTKVLAGDVYGIYVVFSG